MNMNKVLFDPKQLNEEQFAYLSQKLERVSSPEDRDGCRRFLNSGRVDGRYGKIKARVDISRKFGKEDRSYNASKLLYCLINGVAWHSDMGLECSHLCGFSLCMKVEHIILETHSSNSSRKEHHTSFDCNGEHGIYPDCIIKSYTPAV